MKTSQANPSKKKNGYVLIDALVTVIISTAVFTVIIGGISTAANAIIKSRERIVISVEERNSFEKTRWTKATPPPKSP